MVHFDLGLGSAFGKDRLVVDGEGFEAEGRQWSFEEVDKGARNRLEFSQDAKVAFAHEVGGFLHWDQKFPRKIKNIIKAERHRIEAQESCENFQLSPKQKNSS